MKRDVILSQYKELLGNIGDVESYHILNELRRYVDRFLCESVQNEKFFDWLLFSSIIGTSADQCPQFSGKLAAQCFDSLEKIAKNIILFKWRRTNEYSTISTHTPFYMEKLTKTLIGYDKIFDRLGYIFDESRDVWTFNADSSSSLDNLLKIAVDCFIGSIECQIIQTIKNLTSDHNISWSDVIKCRTTTTGSTELCRKQLMAGRDFRSATTSSIKNVNDDLIQCNVDADDIVKPSSSTSAKNNLLRVLNRNSSFNGLSSSAAKENQSKSKTTWYVNDSQADAVNSMSKPKLTPIQIRPMKNPPRPTTVPKENSTRPMIFPTKNSTQPTSTAKNVTLPKIDAQNVNLVSKNFLHSNNIQISRSRDASPSATNLNSYLNNLQPTLNVVKERIKTIRDDAAAGGCASPTTPTTDFDGRECPKCRMINRQKDVIICAYCSFYFPV